MTSRDLILGRLRATRPLLPAAPSVAPLASPTPSTDERVTRFGVEAAALGIVCFVESSVGDVQGRLATLVSDRRVLSWDADQMPYDLSAVLAGALSGTAARDEQAAAELGVTGCDAAIAETASLVLFSGQGRTRAASLLPPMHVAVVQRDRIYVSMADVFATYADRLRDSAACTIITGPSRTADIELTLTLGIHGPGRVVVIVGP